MFDLINIFDVFLPQLLAYPNASDPLNSEAAATLMREPERYKKNVRDYIEKYAKEEDAKFEKQQDEEDEEEDSLSSASEGDENDLAEFEL